MTSIAHDDPVVVIIGSGAGGGTMAYELTRNGVPCVLIEALQAATSAWTTATMSGPRSARWPGF